MKSMRQEVNKDKKEEQNSDDEYHLVEDAIQDESDDELVLISFSTEGELQDQEKNQQQEKQADEQNLLEHEQKQKKTLKESSEDVTGTFFLTPMMFYPFRFNSQTGKIEANQFPFSMPLPQYQNTLRTLRTKTDFDEEILAGNDDLELEPVEPQKSPKSSIM